MTAVQFDTNRMNSWTNPLVSILQAGEGAVMVFGMWHTLGPLIPINHHLDATEYLSIADDHVRPFMATITHLLMATSSIIIHHVTNQK